MIGVCVHNHFLPVEELKKVFQLIRVDWAGAGTNEAVIDRLVKHYKDFTIYLTVHSMKDALRAKQLWPHVKINFKNEPDLKEHSNVEPLDYITLTRSLASRGCPVWGPGLSTWKNVAWREEFIKEKGLDRLAGVDIHGYQMDFAELVREIRKYTRKPIIIGEWRDTTSGPSPNRAETVAHAIKSCPQGVGLVIYRGPDEGDQTGFFTNENWTLPVSRPLPEWYQLLKMLGRTQF